MWNGLPVIRREIAESMITTFGLTQKETAQKIGVTPAAICQYVSKKRGKTEISNVIVKNEIKISAENIIKNDHNTIISETCRICKIMRDNQIFPFFCPACDE